MWYRVTTNNETIQRVSEDVASAFPELTTFSATEVLIVTWDNVGYRCSSEEVSFNFILTKTKYLVWIKITSLLILSVLEINTKVYNPNLPNHINVPAQHCITSVNKLSDRPDHSTTTLQHHYVSNIHITNFSLTESHISVCSSNKWCSFLCFLFVWRCKFIHM